MRKWSHLYADLPPTSRSLNRFCLGLLLVMGGNLFYARSWLGIPFSLDPLVWVLLGQIGLGIVYFVGRQVMPGQQQRVKEWGNQDEK